MLKCFGLFDRTTNAPPNAKPMDVGGNLFGHIMVDTTIQEKLQRLDYSQVWLDSGILTEIMLTQQIKQLDSGEDYNTEHYRYRTLTNYFNQQTSFDNNALKQILQLLHTDIDKTMAASATITLLKKPHLTDEQFDVVADFLQTFGDWTTKQIEKTRQNRTKHCGPT